MSITKTNVSNIIKQSQNVNVNGYGNKTVSDIDLHLAEASNQIDLAMKQYKNKQFNRELAITNAMASLKRAMQTLD